MHQKSNNEALVHHGSLHGMTILPVEFMSRKFQLFRGEILQREIKGKSTETKHFDFS